MATVEPEELKKKTKMVAYDTLSKIGCAYHITKVAEG
jgi:hypothetical protein